MLFFLPLHFSLSPRLCGLPRLFSLLYILWCLGSAPRYEIGSWRVTSCQKGWREWLKRTVPVPVLWSSARFQLPFPEPDGRVSRYPALQRKHLLALRIREDLRISRPSNSVK